MNLTAMLSTERKAEIIYLHCVRGEEIQGDDSWHIAELAALYGIRIPEERLKGCYSNTYTYREIYNLMLTYPEGLDNNVKFEDEILNIALNKYKYINNGKNVHDVRLNSSYDKYDRDFEEKEEFNNYSEIKMPFNRSVREIKRNFAEIFSSGVISGMLLVLLGFCTYDRHFPSYSRDFRIWRLFRTLEWYELVFIAVIMAVVCVVVYFMMRFRLEKVMFIVFCITALLFAISNIVTKQIVGVILGAAVIFLSGKNILHKKLF